MKQKVSWWFMALLTAAMLIISGCPMDDGGQEAQDDPDLGIMVKETALRIFDYEVNGSSGGVLIKKFLSTQVLRAYLNGETKNRQAGGTPTVLKINTIEGRPVTEIAERAFAAGVEGIPDITTVVQAVWLPKTIEALGASLFAGVASPINVEIPPEAIQKIKDHIRAEGVPEAEVEAAFQEMAEAAVAGSSVVLLQPDGGEEIAVGPERPISPQPDPDPDPTIPSTPPRPPSGGGDFPPYVTYHVITFDSHGGSAVNPITQPEGSNVARPTDPTRAGYTFQGWFNAETGGSEYTTWPHPLTANVTMHAQWKINYTITFESHGGSAVEAVTLAEGSDVAEPTAPTRGGYVFQGWFDAETGGNAYTPWPHILTEDVTMHAQWKVLITLDIEAFTDEAENISGISEPITLVTGNTETITITVTGNDVNSVVTWYRGLVQIDTGTSLTLNSANLSLGTHKLRVTAVYDGVLYSKEFSVTVTN